MYCGRAQRSRYRYADAAIGLPSTPAGLIPNRPDDPSAYFAGGSAIAIDVQGAGTELIRLTNAAHLLTHIYHLIVLADLATEQEIVASHRICYGGAAAAFFLIADVGIRPGNRATARSLYPRCVSALRRLMPDPHRVEGCLRANGPNLSRPCYDVFFPPQDVPPPQAGGPRRRFNGPQSPPPPQDDED